MTDINFILITAFTTMFSFVFFVLAVEQGIGKIGDIDFAKALIYYFVSLMSSVLCIGLFLSMDTSFAVAYWYIPFFFFVIDFVMVVFTGWKAYLHQQSGRMNRNRRYNANED